MMLSTKIAQLAPGLSEEEIKITLHSGLDGRFTDQRVLMIVPDHTRTLPLPLFFKSIVHLLADARQLDLMIALGTHPPLSREGISNLLGIRPEAMDHDFSKISFFNHAWDDESQLSLLDQFSPSDMKQLAGSKWHPSLPESVAIRINKKALEYDRLLIISPIFPHEVAGFSGGAKYLFPGISGSEMIHATHWLGALSGVVGTIGHKDTPVRRMIKAAAGKLSTPLTLISLVMEGDDVSGIFIGDLDEAWNSAVDLSALKNILWMDHAYQKVLSCAPPMYDELWTAAKAMYKLEPVVAPGGELILYAPHLKEISRVHGKWIREIGYHCLPYFLENWDHYRHVPLGILAHSTHLRGSGRMENGIEKPNIYLTLCSQISKEDCTQLGLGYLDPARIDPLKWRDDADQFQLFVPRAGEILYKLNQPLKKFDPHQE